MGSFNIRSFWSFYVLAWMQQTVILTLILKSLKRDNYTKVIVNGKMQKRNINLLTLFKPGKEMHVSLKLCRDVP